jgi:RimJ/RimL family protein N-acetyltransferase
MEFKIPERVTTDRLILRSFVESDWKDLYPYYSDIETMRYTIGRELSEGETWRTVAGMIGHWVLRRYGPYALEEKESGRVIGVCGLWYPNDWPEPEIKWGLNKNYHGKGFASEAARKVKAVAREYLPDTSLISLINMENSPSIHLALALGCHLEKKIVFRGQDCGIYRHP